MSYTQRFIGFFFRLKWFFCVCRINKIVKELWQVTYKGMTSLFTTDNKSNKHVVPIPNKQQTRQWHRHDRHSLERRRRRQHRHAPPVYLNLTVFLLLLSIGRFVVLNIDFLGFGCSLLLGCFVLFDSTHWRNEHARKGTTIEWWWWRATSRSICVVAVLRVRRYLYRLCVSFVHLWILRWCRCLRKYYQRLVFSGIHRQSSDWIFFLFVCLFAFW